MKIEDNKIILSHKLGEKVWVLMENGKFYNLPIIGISVDIDTFSYCRYSVNIDNYLKELKEDKNPRFVTRYIFSNSEVFDTLEEAKKHYNK